MTSVFEYAETTKGGLGNQLFQLNLISQLAVQYGIKGYFPQNSYVAGLKPWAVRFRKSTRPKSPSLSWDFLANSPWTEVLDELECQIARGEIIRLPIGLLGHRFAESCRISPKTLFGWPRERNETSENHDFRVALHLRGEDFFNWDHKAVPTADYYLNALDDVLHSRRGEVSEVRAVTDDLTLPAAERLRSAGISVSSGPWRTDFGTLRNADLIIAPPSTFSVWAALLGAGRAVFPSSWVIRRAENGDSFWARVMRNTVPHLNASLIE